MKWNSQILKVYSDFSTLCSLVEPVLQSHWANVKVCVVLIFAVQCCLTFLKRSVQITEGSGRWSRGADVRVTFLMWPSSQRLCVPETMCACLQRLSLYLGGTGQSFCVRHCGYSRKNVCVVISASRETDSLYMPIWPSYRLNHGFKPR